MAPGEATDRTVEISEGVLSRLGVFFKDLQTGDGFPNCHWLSFGHGFQKMQGERWLELIHPDDRERARLAFDAHMRGETDSFHVEYRVRDAAGEYHWMISNGIVEQRAPDGTPLRYVGHDEDVTKLHVLREELEEAQREAEERAIEAEALRGAGAAVVATLDAPTAVRSVIEQLRTLVDFESAFVCEVENRSLRFVGGSAGLGEQSWKRVARLNRSALLRAIQSRTPDVVTHDRSERGQTLFVPLVVRGATVGVLAISRTSSRIEGEEIRVTMSMADYLALALSNARLYQRMQQRAEVDQLSGVLTRRAFLETAEQLVDESFHKREPVCCMILDVDHFKSINDTYGHPVGDQTIRTLGAIMRDSLRSTDLVGRFGGEEFCALLGETRIERGCEVADRLRRAIEETNFPGVDRVVTASIGIAEAANAGEPGDGRLTIEQLIKHADEALYQAKASGRNRVTTHAQTRAEA